MLSPTLPPWPAPNVITVHSASSLSPAARGTRYSAVRVGFDGARRFHRDGSSQRRPRAPPVGVEVEVAVVVVVVVEAAVDSGSAGAFEHATAAARDMAAIVARTITP